MAALPITVSSVINLADPDHEIPETYYRSGNTTSEGGRNVCVCIKKPNLPSQLVIVDVQTGAHKTKNLTEQAEAAFMHPTENVITVRGKAESGHFIQVFHLETKERLGEHQFEEEVAFWKWASTKILAIVTKTHVYHWTVESGSPQSPVKMFPLTGRLAASGVQIINYCVDQEVRWCLLVGISTQDGRTIDGHMQLYSVDRQKEQLLDGHAGCFATLSVNEAKGPTSVFAFAEKSQGSNRLHIRDINAARGEGFKVTADITYPPEATNDFPVGMHISPTYGVLYVVTKGGWLFVFDCVSGTAIFTHKISADTVFLSSYNPANGGILAVNKRGLVLTAALNEDTATFYIQTHVHNGKEIALSLARRHGLPGMDDQLILQFNQFFAQANYAAAARIAAVMKSGALRTNHTIEKFKAVPKTGDQPSAILQYFSTLLEYGKLNATESIELCMPVVAQGRRDFIEKWLQESKLECTEQLGDLIKPLDTTLALQVYYIAEVSAKVVHCYVEQNEYKKIIAYAKRTGYQVDFSFIMRNMATVNHEAAGAFAKQLLLDSDPPLVDVNVVIDILTQQNAIAEVTSILLEFLKGNKTEYGYLQTKLLEINLLHTPQIAEAIFQMGMFSHYDRKRIGLLAEKAGLYQRALEHYTDASDIRRVITLTGGQLSPEWLSTYLGKLAPEAALECLTDMLRTNRQHLQPVVQMAIKYHEKLGTLQLVAMFESFESWEGVFCYLGSILAFSSDPEVHYKYIEAAAKLNHLSEVERVCRESKVYDPVRVKDFLKQARLADPRPLIYLCDLHGYEAELAEYLYSHSLLKFIEVFVTRMNTQKAPVILGRLIDLDCSEDFIKSLLQQVRGAAPTAPLVEEFEKRNRLSLLISWLEARLAEQNQEPELHNALAKIYIDTNNEPENFLKNNNYYDSKIVGLYCEDRDPHLACTAYKRARDGSCDHELVNVTNKNGLYRLQARYLVERQSAELWAVVLDPNNEHRRNVIDQVVSSALPESCEPDEVSVTVKAFILANLPQDLIELLEKIVLHNSDFSTNKNLQNLLLLTAMKADPSRVMDYVNRLDCYEGKEIADIALKDDYGLYEEAFQIYRKFNMDVEAVQTLICHIKSIDRAAEFAGRQKSPQVWSALGSAQLEAGFVADAISSFLKGEDPAQYKAVIEAATAKELFEPLVEYLQMSRKAATANKDSVIDSEYVYALARSDKLDRMASFLEGTNTANLQSVADRLFAVGCFAASKLLYTIIPNNAGVANCHLKLGEFKLAVEAAKKANSPKTWKEVNMACVLARESECAHTAGLYIILHPDHLDELILNYEKNGLKDDLITLLESGVQSERVHIGIYTELGVLYAKYSPAKLSEYIRSATQTATRFNMAKLIRTCERHQLWNDAVYLHSTYDEIDQAVHIVIQHSISTWSHNTFSKLLQKVTNAEIVYRAIAFYLDEHPLLLSSLLSAVSAKIDPHRIVQQLRQAGELALVLPYLKHVQSQNILTVNDAVNELLLESYDAGGLKHSVTEHDNFDQLALAKKLENHELLEMRRIATMLYKKNQKFAAALQISKSDAQTRDLIATARDSADPLVVEQILRHFADTLNKICFTATLVCCYGLVPAHVVLEIGWRYGLTEQILPFMTQLMKDYHLRFERLERKLNACEENAKKEKSAPNDFAPTAYSTYPQQRDMFGGPVLPGMTNLALTSGPASASASSSSANVGLLGVSGSSAFGLAADGGGVGGGANHTFFAGAAGRGWGVSKF